MGPANARFHIVRGGVKVVLGNGFVSEQVLLEFWNAMQLVFILLVMVDFLQQAVYLCGGERFIQCHG